VIEIAAAAFLPPVALLLLTWRLPELRKAAARWFIPLTLLWFAPFWLTGTSPAPFDYLFEAVGPWSYLKLPGFAAGNALLSDAPLQFLPWRELVTQAYRHGELPFLNRFAGAGSPLWENPSAGVLSPLTILGLAFSTFAWPLFAAVSKTLICLTGTFVFIRQQRSSVGAATVGAIAYAFCTYSTAFMLFPQTNVSMLLPWLLWAIAEATIRWRGAAFAAVVVAMMLLGGHVESVLHVAFLAIPFALREGRWRKGPLPRYAAAAATGALLAAPVLLPFLAMLPFTERAARLIAEPTLVNAPPLAAVNLIPFVFPARFWGATDGPENFNEIATQYAGLSALVLFIYGAMLQPRRQRFWIAAFVVLTLLAFWSVPVHAVTDLLPVVRMALNGRVRFLLAFIVAVGAAAGFDLLDENRRRLRLVAAACGALLAAIAASTLIAGAGNRPLLAGSALLAALGVAVVLRAPRWLPLVLFADLAVLGLACHPPVGRDSFYPATPVVDFLRSRQGPFRIVSLENMLQPNTAAMLGVEDLGMHDPASYEPYGRMLEQAGYDRRFYFSVFHALPPRELLSALAVHYVVAPPGTEVSGLNAVYRGPDAVVFALPPVPRFAATGVRVKRIRYGRSDAELLTESVAPATLVSSEIALPGWRVLCDGKAWPSGSSRPAPLAHRDIDGPFLTWQVPAGRHHFLVSYRPVRFVSGVFASVAGLAALVLMGSRRDALRAE